jgi:voltage-gated potassium channel
MSKHTINEIIIGVLALVSIVLIAVESLASLTKSELIAIYVADFAICIVFAIDFIRRLRSSEDKGRYMKNNGFEILAMVPAVALYGLGTIPAISIAFRSLRMIRVLRVLLMLARLRRVFYRMDSFVRRSHLLTLFVITAIVIFAGAYAVMVLDSGTEHAQITNLSDAIWWSISTVTTVGYGDIVPHSTAGRIMGMVLMVIGIGIMTTFISVVSATIVETRIKREVKDVKSTLLTEIKNKLDDIDNLSESELSLLIQMIQALKPKVGDNR